MKELCVFNPQSLAGFGPHAKVRFCRPAAHGQTLKVKPDLAQHLLPAEDPLCAGRKAGLLTVAFKPPGYLALAAYSLTSHRWDPLHTLILPDLRGHGSTSTGAFSSLAPSTSVDSLHG